VCKDLKIKDKIILEKNIGKTKGKNIGKWGQKKECV
jgi:hypothetical protein